MKNVLAGVFLLLFVFQTTLFGETLQTVPEPGLKKAGKETMVFVQKAIWGVWEAAYLTLKKIDVA